MARRVKLFIALILLAAGVSVRLAATSPSHSWVRFCMYLVVVLLSSGLKVPLPKGDGTMSVNFPFILLSIVQLSMGQAIAIAAISVFAQCRFKVLKQFTIVQTAFNVANVVVSTALAWFTFTVCIRHNVELAPALSIGATAYFFANTVPVATVIAWSKGESPLDLWKREFPWYLPLYLVGAILASVAHLVSVRFGWTTSLLLVPLVYTIYRAYRAQTKSIQERQVHLEETEALQLRTIEGLAMAIEAKDHNTHKHLLRVRVYVSEIGVLMGLEKELMQALLTAAFLHDIGKLAVPEHLINKPGKLTPEEFDKMKIHPVVGADILERVRFPYPVVPIVRSHHEAWDGSGYPDGLIGEAIPIGARILTVVDCFDALASDRPYRKALPLDKAMEFVKSKAGSQFDPAVVAVLEQNYAELEHKANAQRAAVLAPLNTEVAVWRGAAPSAGFQQENVDTAPNKSAESELPSTLATPNEFKTRLGLLNRIGEANLEAQAVFEMSQILGSSLSPNETISVISSRLCRLVPFDCFAVYRMADNALTLQYMDGVGAVCFGSGQLPLGKGLSGWVADCGKAILNGNPKVEQTYIANGDSAMQLNSALSLPLFDPSGEVFGVLTLYSARLDAFSRDHMRILQAVEAKFSLSLGNALRLRKAESDIRIDGVTQLPQVPQFFVRMEAELNTARRAGESLAIVVCDLDAFKAVNDLYGYQAGNVVLSAILEGLRECCRSCDTIARIGGDKFVFLLPGLTGETCSPLLKMMDETVRNSSREIQVDIQVSASMGTAFYPADGDTAEELLGLADGRMYSNKRPYYECVLGTEQTILHGMAATA